MNFRNFETSSGKLVLAGKDAKNNEELIAQISPEEDVFHTAKPGSPFVNLKSKNSSPRDTQGGHENLQAGDSSKDDTAVPSGEPSSDDIKESAIFCAAKSQD